MNGRLGHSEIAATLLWGSHAVSLLVFQTGCWKAALP